MPDLSNSGKDLARRRRGDKARVLVSAVIGLIGGFTVIYFGTLSLFIKPITEEFGWGRTELSALAALAMIGNAVGASIAGRLAERYGSRPIVAGSGVMLGIGLAGLAAAPASQVFFAVAGLSIGLFTAGTTTVGHLVNLPRFFEERLGRALAIVMAGSALGPAAVQLLTDAVIGSSGWRSAYLVLAIVAITCTTVSVLIGFPAGTGPQPRGLTEETAEVPPGPRSREALLSLRAATLFGCTALVAAATLGFSVHLVALFTDRGLGTTTAVGVAAGAGIGVVIGRLLIGVLLDRVSAVRIGGVTFTLASAGFVVLSLPVASSPVLYSLGAVLVAVALGAEGDLVPFMVRRYFGMRSYPSVLGVMLGAFALGGAIGPVLYGLSFDLLNSYEPALGLSALVVLAAAVGLQTLGPYRYPSAGRLPVDSSPPTRRG